MRYLYTKPPHLYRLAALRDRVTRPGDRDHIPFVQFQVQEMHLVKDEMTPGGTNLVPSAALRQQLMSLGEVVRRRKGTILFRRGDAAVGLYLIISGKISLGLETESPVFPTRLLSEGCIAGLPATVSGNPYSLTAEVIKDADLAFVKREAVLEMLQSDATLCFQVMDMLSGEISEIRSALKTTDLSRRTRN